MSSTCHLSDVGNAEYFARYYKNQLIFNWQQHQWYFWTGVRWSRCDVGQQVEMAKAAMRRRREEAEKIKDDEARRHEIKWTLTSEGQNRLTAMVELAKSTRELADNGREWDQDPYLVGCPDGYIDLSDGGKFKPAKPSVKILNSVSISPKAGRPKRWLQFLDEIFEGDQDLIDYIHRALGYSLTGDVSERVLFCLYGTGKNGKSTFTETVKMICGSYAYTMPFSTIERMTNERISNDIASLVGKRQIIASEVKEDIRLNEGRIKALTGNEVMTCRHLYKENFSFPPTGKFWLAFNHKPLARDDSEGFWDRLKLIPFRRRFKAEETDMYLMERLREEMPMILGWMVDGGLDWRPNRLGNNKTIDAETATYRLESNSLTEWYEDNFERHENAWTPVTSTFDNYIGWCTGVNERFPCSRQGFNRRLEAMGFVRGVVEVRGVSIKVWKGLKSKDIPSITTTS